MGLYFRPELLVVGWYIGSRSLLLRGLDFSVLSSRFRFIDALTLHVERMANGIMLTIAVIAALVPLNRARCSKIASMMAPTQQLQRSVKKLGTLVGEVTRLEEMKGTSAAKFVSVTSKCAIKATAGLSGTCLSLIHI